MTHHTRTYLRALAALALIPAGYAQQFFNGGSVWNTSTSNWSATSNGPYTAAWANLGGSAATFVGTPSTVTVGTVNAANLTFGTAGYNLNGGTISITTNRSLVFQNGGLTTIGSAIAGTGNMTFTGSNSGSGAGTLTLSGTNTYSGITTINGGTVNVSSLANNFGSNINLNIGNGGNLNYTGAGENTARVVNLNGTNTNSTLTQSGTGLLKFTSNFTATGIGAKTLILQGAGTGTGEISGAIVDNVGSLTNLAVATSTTPTSTINLGSVTGVNVGAKITGTGIAAGTTITGIAGKVVTLSQPTNGVAMAVNTAITVDGATITNSTALTKAGTGTWMLSGTNTYTGTTTVTGGTLLVNGSTSTGNVAVNTGATLGGSGTVGGATTIANGAFLAAGNSPGQLNFGSSLILNDTSTTTMELAGNGRVAGTDFDKIVVTGAITFNGTLNIVSFSGYELNQTASYDLFDFGPSSSGNFANVSVASTTLTRSLGIWAGSTLDGSVNYSFNQADGILTVSAVPEPSTYAVLAGLGILGFAVYRRRQA